MATMDGGGAAGGRRAAESGAAAESGGRLDADAPVGRGASVAGFLPSTHGFAFTNDFPPGPVLRIGPAGRPQLAIGDASRGLCGGMTFAVRDLFEAGRPPPTTDQPPAPGSPLFRYLVRRLIESWDLPGGGLSYYRLMLTPPADRLLTVATRRGVGHRTAVEEWPRVRLDLEQGVLSPLGLVTERSANPLRLGYNHQVLAYGYRQVGTVVTLRIYDPNTPRPHADDVRLVFDGGRPATGVPIQHNVTITRPIRTFFRARYRPRIPPPA